MNKQETIERLCNLVSDVGSNRFQEEFAHDCFCEGNPSFMRVEEEVIEFIEDAVKVADDNVGLYWESLDEDGREDFKQTLNSGGGMKEAWIKVAEARYEMCSLEEPNDETS